MTIVRPVESAVVEMHGIPRAIRRGEEYDSEDEIVLTHPLMFASDVERATAAPGERRSVRLPRQKK